MGSVLRRSVIALLLLLVASPAWGQAVFDAVGNGHCGTIAGETACGGGGTTLTYPITLGVGSNRQISVFGFIGCANGTETPPTATATYATQALTQVLTSAPSGRRSYLWAWPTGSQPTSGLDNVVITLSGTDCTPANGFGLQSGAISATGVDQATTFSSTNSASGDSSTTPSVTISTSGASDLVVFAVCNGTSVTNNGNNVGTQRWLSTGISALATCDNSGGASAPGGNLTLTWTAGVDFWQMVAGSLKAAAAAGGAPQRTLTGVGQ